MPKVVLGTLTGTVPYHAERALKDLADQGNQQDDQLSTLSATVKALPPPLTLADIQKALSSTGSNPLNITALLGQVTNTLIMVDVFSNRPAPNKVVAGTVFSASDRGYQTWRVMTGQWVLLEGWGGPMSGTVLGPDNRPTGLTANDNGFLFQGVDANGGQWRWSGTAWVFQIGSGVPIEVTLNPSTLPALTVHDVGFGVWATDYHRFYLWSGVGWQEGEHNDARYQIGWFNAVPDQQGWFRCDGSLVQQSTGTAGVTSYTTPNLINQFVQGGAAAGATGGSAAHSHPVTSPDFQTGGPSVINTDQPSNPSTGQPSSTILVDDNLTGSSTSVGDAVHTHIMPHTHSHVHTHDVPSQNFNTNVASSLPPYYTAIPYIRL